MGFYELRYHLRRMWAKYGLRDVIVNANGTIMFKFRDEIGMKKVIDQSPWMVKNVPVFAQQWNLEIGMKVTEPEKLPIRVKLMNLPMEAWSVEGISALASGIGTPIVMDNTTAHMCQYGSRRSDFARVLIEIDAKKEMKDVIKIQYTDKERKVRGTKEVKIGYDWKPLMCSYCKVFGHNHDKYTVRPRTVEEIAAKKRDEENMQKERMERGNDEFTQVQYRRNKSMHKRKEWNNKGNNGGQQKQEYRIKKSTNVNKQTRDADNTNGSGKETTSKHRNNEGSRPTKATKIHLKC
ncbi:RNA-directed DNA polymerase, eukaryota, reverse transcriptase zinc-binding domain protein [Tanacetum coccineum]